MQVPLETSFRGLTDAEAAEARAVIEQQVERLERLASDIISCRVAVEQPQTSMRSGNPFRVCIRLTVPPHEEVVVDHEPTNNEAHSTLGHVIRHAFQSAGRQLVRAEETKRGFVRVQA